MPGLVMVKSNDELDREEAERVEAEQQAQDQNQRQLESSLAAHIKRRWEVMRRYKQPIEERMLENLRRISGHYSESKREEIQQQGLPLIFMQLTSVKCRAAKSWIRDVLMPAGDRPWQLTPSADPSLRQSEEQALKQRVKRDAMQFMQVTGEQLGPADVQSKFEEVRDKLNERRYKLAKDKTERMADTIEDQLVEGGWNQQLQDVISDIVDYPAGIMKAPVMRRKKQLRWDGATMAVDEQVNPEVERVNPFNFFMAPGAIDTEDGDCIEIHEYLPEDVYELIGLPGYDEDRIREAMNDYERHGIAHWTRKALRTEQDRARGHLSYNEEANNEIIEALEYWGNVRGERLQEWGVSPEVVPDKDKSYPIMAMLIGSHVVAVRLNPDPLGRNPYAKASFEDIPGAFWGKGVPDLISDCQDICNASARALVANMGIASGPQVAINTPSVAPGEDIEQMYPWKIWQLDYSKTGQSSRAPMDFFQPNNMTHELMEVYRYFAELADEYSGIPSYTYGMDNASGAGETASGLSMLMNAASKAIKNVVKHLDSGIIEPVVHRFYVHNMLWNPDESIKGDARVVARGAMSLVSKEQNQMRIQELLQQTANPLDHNILGDEGRAAMLRHALEGLDVGAEELVPDEKELKRRQQLQMAMQNQQQDEQAGQAQGQQGESGPSQGGSANQPQQSEQRPDGQKAGVQTQ